MGLTRWIAAALGLLLWLSWAAVAQADGLAPGDRCLLAVQHEEYDVAIASCTQALQLDAETADYRLSRGLALYRTGHYAEALVDDTQVLATHPEDYRAYYNRGLVRVALHDFGAAIADFDQAAALTAAPTALADIYDDRGLARLMAAQPQAALSDFERALAINSADTRALFNHGCACHQLGHIDAALADLNRLLVLEPDQARTYLTRGIMRQSLGDRTGSLADLRQAADCAQAQGQPHLHHYILTLLNEWQTPSTQLG
ncbi:tetratricopeptide repeat protein [Nodosilinea sp. PGN35]|uniref:tetratricopeptide repeat protein n=1 Tax=Nodosilinea sp. PGN35 TaxID=3020489 RepID=UPI0023B2174D|nr:tetratricopeptide repeat protein [Nodosilinea sp. TSF1-S3]MDF0365896.1 tetratricopeptide repeat protein [Nodosilinea sp. TSF1-S3]